MSSFMVSKRTIDNCVMLIHPSQMTGDVIGTEKGQALIAMNICALIQRYPQMQRHVQAVREFAMEGAARVVRQREGL